MRDIIITTTATVEIEEEWWATVPDDFDTTDMEAVSDLIHGGDAELAREDHGHVLRRDIDKAKEG